MLFYFIGSRFRKGIELLRISFKNKGLIFIFAENKFKTMNELTNIRTKIHEIRGQQVMLDFDLAELYGVETKQLKRAVRRNLERFPPDFMFELNMEEFNSLKMSIRCQIGTLDVTPGDLPKYAPFAFTEQGVAMLSGVLRSPTAIEVNIRIMRAFVAIRRYLATPNCGHCQLEGEVKRLAAYIEEILADQNEINEDTRNALAVLQAAVFPVDGTDKEKRIFNITVKGFHE